MKRKSEIKHISWFIDLFNQNRLNLNTPRNYESKEWELSVQIKFIASILNDTPTPLIILQFDSEDKTYNIIDGKQRLLTILDYYNETLISGKFSKISILPENLKRAFYDYPIHVDIILDDDYYLLSKIILDING